MYYFYNKNSMYKIKVRLVKAELKNGGCLISPSVVFMDQRSIFLALL